MCSLWHAHSSIAAPLTSNRKSPSLPAAHPRPSPLLVPLHPLTPRHFTPQPVPPISILAQQFMGSLNSPLGISSTDGSWNYADPKALAHARTPIFGINGDRDLFCPAAGGAHVVQTGPQQLNGTSSQSSRGHCQLQVGGVIHSVRASQHSSSCTHCSPLQLALF